MSKKLSCTTEQLANLYYEWKNGAYGIIDFGQCVHIKYANKKAKFPTLLNESNEFKAYHLARQHCKEPLCKMEYAA